MRVGVEVFSQLAALAEAARGRGHRSVYQVTGQGRLYAADGSGHDGGMGGRLIRLTAVPALHEPTRMVFGRRGHAPLHAAPGTDEGASGLVAAGAHTTAD
ncbi:MAG: hypothetical protein M3O70_16090 [Actinomycetota bacterium]|nr:hypothetical protein [Actinomycetota bacterium]